MGRALEYAVLTVLIGGLVVAGAMALGRSLEQTFAEGAARIEQASQRR